MSWKTTDDFAPDMKDKFARSAELEFVEGMLLRANKVSWRARTDGCRGDFSEAERVVSTGHDDDLVAGLSKILVQKGRDVECRTVLTAPNADGLNNEG